MRVDNGSQVHTSHGYVGSGGQWPHLSCGWNPLKLRQCLDGMNHGSRPTPLHEITGKKRGLLRRGWKEAHLGMRERFQREGWDGKNITRLLSENGCSFRLVPLACKWKKNECVLCVRGEIAHSLQWLCFRLTKERRGFSFTV